MHFENVKSTFQFRKPTFGKYLDASAAGVLRAAAHYALTLTATNEYSLAKHP